jgi:hypothetical protein
VSTSSRSDSGRMTTAGVIIKVHTRLGADWTLEMNVKGIFVAQVQ